MPFRPKGKSIAIFLPDLNYLRIPGFAKKVSRINPLAIPVTTDKKLIELAKKALIDFGHQEEKAKIASLKKAWKKKEKSFWESVFSLFPNLKTKNIEVEIRPTNYGSICSFEKVNLKKKKFQVKLYCRVDQPIGQIAEAILSSLLASLTNQDNYGFEKREAVFDFLLRHTLLNDVLSVHGRTEYPSYVVALLAFGERRLIPAHGSTGYSACNRCNKIFPDYQPTLAGIKKKQNGYLAIESQKYFKKLGVTSGKIFKLEDRTVIIDGKKSNSLLTQNEKRVLKLLVKNRNQVCSLDDLANAIWQEKADEQFSPWAIAKQVERLRKKLQSRGLSPALIQTQRGQGYLLRD